MQKIADGLNISKKTVIRWIKRYKETENIQR